MNKRGMGRVWSGLWGTFAVGTFAVGCVLAMGGCASETEGDAEPSLVGSWIFVNESATRGLGLTFRPDGTYNVSSMALTSSKSAYATVEEGTFAVSGRTITTTPTAATCPTTAEPSTMTHTFSGGNLLLTVPEGIVALKPSTSTATGDFVLTFGCFDAKGEFKKSNLVSVR